jgi:hypothetical protein
VEEAGASLFSVGLDGPDIVAPGQLVYAKAAALETATSGAGYMHTVCQVARTISTTTRRMIESTDSTKRLLPGLCICA